MPSDHDSDLNEVIAHNDAIKDNADYKGYEVKALLQVTVAALKQAPASDELARLREALQQRADKYREEGQVAPNTFAYEIGQAAGIEEAIAALAPGGDSDA